MKRKFVSIFLILLFIFPIVCGALPSKNYKELECRNGVAVNKAWTIDFKTEVDSKSMLSSIGVLDEQGNEVKVKLELDESEQKVRVIPESNYIFHKEYMLVISDTILDKKGKQIINTGLKMPFTTNGLAVVETEEKIVNIFNDAYKVKNMYGENSSEKVDDNGMTTDKDYSETNNQVNGVDEGDIIKTDGNYIYSVDKTKSKIRIIKAYPEEELSEVNTINYGSNFRVSELYVDNKYLIAVGVYRYREDEFYKSYSGEKDSLIKSQESEKVAPINEVPQQIYEFTTKALVYDITNKKAPVKIREVEIDGRYSSSRKIGSKLYLIANEYKPGYHYYGYGLKDKAIELRPSFKDSVKDNNSKYVDYNNIYYVPGSVSQDYMTIAAIDLDKTKEAEVISIIGNSNDIYMNQDHLYITTIDQKYKKVKVGKNVYYEPDKYNVKTNIYKFNLEDGKVQFLNKGEIDGLILNQFSMDEYNDMFRIVSTKKKLVNNESVSLNELSILDKNMKVVGKIEEIAPQEEIKSVRFAEDRGYITTSEELYTVELKDFKNPKVIGNLKTIGSNDYLQMYDKNNIIGIGKETNDSGLKIAMFDVSDIANPKEKFSTNIGDEGTDSQVLEDHKSLIFLKDKNIMVLPITVTEMSNKESKAVFQGVYIYEIDETTGFKLKGEITHLTEKEYSEITHSYYYGEKRIDRSTYIDNNIYTLSESMIKVNDINTIEEKNSLNLK